MIGPVCPTGRGSVVPAEAAIGWQPGSMTKNMRWMVLGGIALLAAACGSSGVASNDATVLEVQAVLQGEQDFPMSDDEANCAARNIVDEVDSDTLDAMLADPDADLGEVADAETSLKVLDGIFDCVDVEDLMIQSMIDDGTPREDAECLARGFGEDELRDFMRAASGGDDALSEEAGMQLFAKMFELAAECGMSLGG